MRLPTDSLIPTQAIFREPDERVRFVTVRHTEGLFAQQKRWLSPHRKNYHLLMLLTQGRGRYWVDSVPYEFGADTLFFATPEQVHAKEDVQTSGTVICFAPEFFTFGPHADLLQLPFLRHPHLGQGLQPTPGDLAELRQVCRLIVREYEQPADLHDELLYAYLRVLLLSVGRLSRQQHGPAAPAAAPSLYHRLQAGIEAHYKTLREVPDYARLLHLSASHLNASVKAHSGKTVLQHVHERQVLEAKRLLYTTELSVKEIAFELGFRDTSYFTRFFKRLAGCTPLAYRAARQ